jgi:hypothetical protein
VLCSGLLLLLLPLLPALFDLLLYQAVLLEIA